MKKKLWVGILIGVIFGMLLLPLTAGGQQVVTFPDKNLEKAVREAIGKPTGSIRAADLEKIIVFDARLKSISDLTGLGYCTNLKSLWLGSNQISDIKPLVSNSGLSKGDRVYLGSNPLSPTSTNVYIPKLEKRGVKVYYE